MPGVSESPMASVVYRHSFLMLCGTRLCVCLCAYVRTHFYVHVYGQIAFVDDIAAPIKTFDYALGIYFIIDVLINFRKVLPLHKSQHSLEPTLLGANTTCSLTPRGTKHYLEPQHCSRSNLLGNQHYSRSTLLGNQHYSRSTLLGSQHYSRSTLLSSQHWSEFRTRMPPNSIPGLWPTGCHGANQPWGRRTFTLLRHSRRIFARPIHPCLLMPRSVYRHVYRHVCKHVCTHLSDTIGKLSSRRSKGAPGPSTSMRG